MSLSFVTGNHQTVLDYLREVEPGLNRTVLRIAKEIDLGEATVREILSCERLYGRVTASKHGFRLTSAYRDELNNVVNVPVAEPVQFKPLSKSRHMKVTSNRGDDCDKWRKYGSLHAPMTKPV